MRLLLRILLAVVFVLLVGVSASPASGAKKGEPIPTYDRLRFFLTQSHTSFAADEPFFVSHGWTVEPGMKVDDHNVGLFIDGVQQAHQFLDCAELDLEPGVRCRMFLFDYPDGLPAGEHRFDIMFLGPCEAWLPNQALPNPFTDCVDPDAVVAHPSLTASYVVDFVSP